MPLRDYQIAATTQIKQQFIDGYKKVLLVMPTGAGKTVVFCEMVAGVLSRGKRALILVRGRKLVDQASQRLFRENIPHGVIMANHWNKRPGAAVQVCSIDTLIARNMTPDADFIVIDEAHLFDPKSQAAELLARYEGKVFVVAVTATPYVKGGLKHLAETVVRPIKMQELMDQGHLVPFRYFAPSDPDLRAVKTVRGDYKNDQLEDAMTKGHLTGDIIEHWKNIAEGRPTICFAVNVRHSKLLAEKFNESGIRAEHCDADSTDAQRNEAIRRLESGEIKVICNVGILCTGVDIPCLGAIIFARPTKSYNLYIQQSGRGTRTSSGKHDCILLDHAGNIKRHGFPTLEPEADLDGIPKSDTHASESKVCKKCFTIYRGPNCPGCGEKPPVEREDILEGEGELVEMAPKTPVEMFYDQLKFKQKMKGYKKVWLYYKLLEKFSREECGKLIPHWFVPMEKEKVS